MKNYLKNSVIFSYEEVHRTKNISSNRLFSDCFLAFPWCYFVSRILKYFFFKSDLEIPSILKIGIKTSNSLVKTNAIFNETQSQSFACLKGDRESISIAIRSSR